MTGKELAEALSNFVNGASKNDMREFVEQLTRREHRTLQQRAMSLFVGCIERWAEDLDTNRFDLRNEATVRLAARFVQATDKYERALPLI